MVDYYIEILEISRKYFGYSAPGFVRAIFSSLGIAKREIDENDVRRFAEEISRAAGKFLANEKKKQFKEEVLSLIK